MYCCTTSYLDLCFIHLSACFPPHVARLNLLLSTVSAHHTGDWFPGVLPAPYLSSLALSLSRVSH